MIVACLTLSAAFLQLVKTLIEKFVPSNMTKTREFKAKKKAIKALTDFHGKTLDEIQRIGIQKGIVTKEEPK